MAFKIIVSYPASMTKETMESKRTAIAKSLGVCCEHVVLVPGNVVVSIANIPDECCEKPEPVTASESDVPTN